MTHTAETEKQRRDDELAAYTDALVEGNVDEQTQIPLAKTVGILARALKPEPPPDELKQRIRRCVAADWPRQQAKAPRRRPSRFIGVPRWAWAAAAALSVLCISAIVLVPAGTTQVAGTVLGGGETVAVIGGVILLLLGGGVAAWFASRRR